jgi:hypothetical protein
VSIRNSGNTDWIVLHRWGGERVGRRKIVKIARRGMGDTRTVRDGQEEGKLKVKRYRYGIGNNLLFGIGRSLRLINAACSRTRYVPTAPLSISGSRENYRLIERISVTLHMGQPNAARGPGTPRYGWRLRCDRWLLTLQTRAQTAAVGLDGSEWEHEGERGLAACVIAKPICDQRPRSGCDSDTRMK